MKHETYGKWQFKLEEGVYTLAELEKLVADLKTAQARIDHHIVQSMQTIRKRKRNEPTNL